MILNNDTSHGAAEQWSSWLGPLAGLPGINFLEIGSWTGCSAAWFLRNILTAGDCWLTCVDTWMGGGGMPELKESVLPEFEAAIMPWTDKVIIRQMRSQEALVQFHPEVFDVIYIDGSHYACDVLSDSVLAWRTLKKGGLMIWDDYLYETDDLLKMPRMAINSFLCCYEKQHKMIGLGYQVCVQKL